MKKHKIQFTIEGNQDDLHGNPIPFQRVIKQMMRSASVRYLNWQSYVRMQYQRQMTVYGIPVVVSDAPEAGTKKNSVKAQLAMARNAIKPIRLTTSKARMDIKISWANGAHGDPDNVWKGIADALFSQDKNLDGSFESAISKDRKGKVEVTIVIFYA